MVRTRLILVAALGVMLAAWMLWPHDVAPVSAGDPVEADVPVRTVFPSPAEPERAAPSPPSQDGADSFEEHLALRRDSMESFGQGTRDSG